MSRLAFAFRAFFSILFSSVLPEDIAAAFGYEIRKEPVAVKPIDVPKESDGALQMLHIFQRDGRLIDFLMEDISAYNDDQVGAAVRVLHRDCRDTLIRYVTLGPVVDAVEGTFQKLDANKAPDPRVYKLIGNVPASGRVPGGILRHRGWRATSVSLPPAAKDDAAVLTPAELEVE